MNRLTIASLVIVLAACGERHASRAAPADSSAVLATIPIEGMVCMSCVANVKRALTRLDGVDAADVNLARREARVWYHADRVTPARLVAAIDALGYHATLPNGAKR